MTVSGSYLLDTNIVIALFAADSAVLDKLSDAEAVFVPAIVLGELYYGAHKSSQPVENADHIVAFAAQNTILACDEETARAYGVFKSQLRAKGKPLPENDIWIGALAHQYDLTLITRDRHFAEMDEISYASW